MSSDDKKKPPEKPLPFSKEYEEKQGPNKGLKLTNKRSSVAKQEAEKAEFEGLADEFMAQKQDRNKRALELSRQFLTALKDKVLPDNKGPLAKSFEKDICDNLILLALEINEDESEREGMGSIAVINLMIKALFIQRDVINALDYKVAELQKDLSRAERKPVKNG